MSTIEDLAAWGEQPPNTAEEALAAFLETALGKIEQGEELSATDCSAVAGSVKSGWRSKSKWVTVWSL